MLRNKLTGKYKKTHVTGSFVMLLTWYKDNISAVS